MINYLKSTCFIIALLLGCKSKTPEAILPNDLNGGASVFVSDINGSCTLLNAKTGALIWKFQTGRYILSSPTFYKNTLFISTTTDEDQSKIIALDYKTGKKKWEFKTPKDNIASPLAMEDKLYCVSYGKLYCLDIKKGTLKWEVSSNKFLDSSPTYDNGFIYIVSDLGLEIFDAKNGIKSKSLRVSQNKTIKEINGIPSYHSSPAIHKGICYFGFQKSLFSYNIQTKQFKNIEFEKVWNESSSSPTIENDVLYVNDDDNLYAVNTSTFTKKWVFKFPLKDLGFVNSSLFVNSPLAVGDLVFATENKNLYAISVQTGTKIWTTEGVFFSSPNYYDSIVYISSKDELRALDSNTGKLLWRFELNNTGLNLFASPLIINDKGEAFHSAINGAKH
jgi:outer membrane protein assembly factor BamB